MSPEPITVATLFANRALVSRIQDRLPKLFYIAELESSRAGKVGMEVGCARERILIALLIYAVGQENVDLDIPTTETEVDVRVQGRPLSIKTITGRTLGGVKAVWTVDAEQASVFCRNYVPRCDILLAQINWDALGALIYFPVSVQTEVFRRLGRERYLKMPKPGTNPRGVEFSAEAFNTMAQHPQKLGIPIRWLRQRFEYNLYERWTSLWEKD